METSILSHVTNSAFVVYLIQYLKGTVWYRKFAAALPIADNKVHVLMSTLGAAGSAIGMHGAVKGGHAEGWVLTLMIPPIWVMAHALWDLGQQLALNQIIFAVAVQQKEAAPVITVPVGHETTITAPLPDPVKVTP